MEVFCICSARYAALAWLLRFWSLFSFFQWTAVVFRRTEFPHKYIAGSVRPQFKVDKIQLVGFILRGIEFVKGGLTHLHAVNVS